MCVSLFSAFLSAFGTAGALSRVMVYSMSALILSVIVFLFDYTHGFSKKNSSALLFVLFSGSIIGSFMYNFHTLNNRKECFYSGSESRYSPYLKYIKIEKKQRDTIDSLILKLNEFGFDKKKDRIFSSYIPGIVAASGARSFGTPFQLYLPNSLHCHDVFTCAFLDLESKKNIRHVYLLLSNEQKVGDKAWTHLFMMIRDCGKRKTSIVGEGPIDVMSESGAMLTLAGPYEFNKNFVPNQEITFHIEHNLERENR
ncbi:hypothetical protein HYD_6220 [Candidatus Hydrogenosomobacter endosymbioticus]|uniref:Uncharacterized protein n=1 Tax=Candidatus Hydrogenosomobacter endosymbioticus TaxID=2558174 RepID=A0ABM7V9P0_9PROT|nr:hypothetical protein HYD_6220 [Candidatus Hydrogenosomobacter endosymbioticus]